MNRSVSKSEVSLVLLKLELALVDLHVKKEELLISCGNTQLILGDCLTSRISSFEDSIIDTEGVYLLANSLNGFHLRPR